MIRYIPVLFSTPMVRSLLDIYHPKSMTRRLVKGAALDVLDAGMLPSYVCDPGGWPLQKYGSPGDVLWVREKWMKNSRPMGWPYHYYAANDVFTNPDQEKWKPSIHMPKTACRIFLQVQSIKVERLQDISEEDAIAEGIQFFKQNGSTWFKDYLADPSGHGDPDHDFPTVPTARNSFQTLWSKIHGHASWDDNPWVWVVSFKSIDQPQNFLS
jgi:hypothetical protein